MKQYTFEFQVAAGGLVTMTCIPEPKHDGKAMKFKKKDQISFSLVKDGLPAPLQSVELIFKSKNGGASPFGPSNKLVWQPGDPVPTIDENGDWTFSPTVTDDTQTVYMMAKDPEMEVDDEGGD